MDIKLLLLYFVLGGTVVALVSYLGTLEKGLLASFFTTLPTVTIITVSIIYSGGGANAALSYLRGMLIMIPAWILYVLITMLLLPRTGLVPALAVGASIYVAIGIVIMRVIH